MVPSEHWVQGTATLIGYRVVARSSREHPFPRAFVAARVVAQADGIEPIAAELKLHTALDRLSLRPGRTFAVLIDPEEPTRVIPQDGDQDIRDTIRDRRAVPRTLDEQAPPPPHATDGGMAFGGGVMPTAFGEP